LAVWGGFQWTAINLPHTFLCPGGCNEGAWNVTSHTWTTLTTPGAHKYSAPGGRGDWILYSGAYHLWVLSAEPGSCYSTGTWNFKVAATCMENLCTSGVLLAQGLLSWKFWLHFWATGCMTCNSSCVSQLAYPQKHTLDEIQILCSESCADFATNISSDDRLHVL
jgi:hypothetical protein